MRWRRSLERGCATSSAVTASASVFTRIHRFPSVDDGQRFALHEGLAVAIEPFLSVGAEEVIEDADDWTLKTTDGSLVAQYEHSVVVTNGAPS
jgi:methionine aminopeptidase